MASAGDSQLLFKARELSKLAQLDYVVSTLKQCNSVFYYDVFKSLTGLKISWSSPCGEDVRCQIIIDSLEEYLSPYVRLDHIQGHNLALVDEVTTNNMLDVFIGLFKTSLSRSVHSGNGESSVSPSLSDVCSTSSQHSVEAESDVKHSDGPIPSCEKEFVLMSLLNSYLRDSETPHQSDLRSTKSLSNTAKSLANSEKTPVTSSNILYQTEQCFPFAYVEQSTVRHLRTRQQQFNDNTTLPSVWKSIDNMHRKQSAMLNILQKGVKHAKNIQECHDRQYCKQYMKAAVHSKRLSRARAWRYFQDYELKLRSKLQAARTKEEQTFIKTFEEGLKLRREAIIDDRKTAKERQKNAVCKKLGAMENSFRESFDDAIKLQQQQLKCVKDCHSQVLDSTRKRIEKEVKEIQCAMCKDDDIQHFRELDATRIKWHIK